MSLFGAFSSWWSERSRPQPPAEDMRGDEAPEFEIDALGWIHGTGVIHMPSARGGASPLLAAGRPVCVVRHGTATAWGTAGAIARSWRATNEPHSAHLTIDVIVADAREAEIARWRNLGWHAEADQLGTRPTGTAVIYQHRSLFATSWHAYGSTGSQRTSGTIDGQHLNAISIGIEATCVGQVARKHDAQWRGWKSGQGVGYGSTVPAEQVQEIGGRDWHTYHPAVLELERELDVLLLARFPSLAATVTITPAPYTVSKLHGELRAKPVTRPAMSVGHIDVDPTRKADPYPTGASRGRGA